MHPTRALLFRRHDIALLLGLMLVALVSVSTGLNHSPFWADEAYTVLAVRAASLTELLQINLLNEETPPLYFVLLRAWAGLWGNSDESTLRLFSALAFAASVPLTGWLGMRIWNRHVGLMAAAMLACNPFLRYYSQEARAYALAVCFSLLLFLAAHAYLQRPHRLAWIGYVLAGTATFYSNYFGAFMLLGTALCCGIPLLGPAWHNEAGARRTLAGLVAAQIAILLLMLPWVPAVLFQVQATAAMNSPEGRSTLLQYLLSVLVLGSAFPDGSSLSLLLLSSIVVILPLSLGTVLVRGNAEQQRFLLTQLVVPSLCVVLAFGGDGQFNPRYLLLSLPAYILVIAAGLTGLVRRPAAAWLLTTVLALGMLSYSVTMTPSRHRQNNWHGLAQTVAAQNQSGDAVFFLPPWAQAPFAIQYAGPTVPFYGATSFVEYYYFGARPFGDSYEQEALYAHLNSGKRAWIAWDRQYARRPYIPPGHRISEYYYGSTTLLLVEPHTGHAAAR